MKKILYKVITLIVLLTGLTNVVHATNYAVIINAESNGEHNHIRYWNDCSAVYQTLLSKGFSQDHIYVAMSDGTDLDDDYLNENGDPDNSSLDLNGDNYPDIQYAATRDDIEHIFLELSDAMTSDDDLFIYTVGEGRVDTFELPPQTYPYIYNPIFTSYLMLWEGGRLKGSDLAHMLEAIHARTINIVMQQSHSGGFIDALREMDNVVITTACGVNEKSYSMENKQYDEFTYHWVSAVKRESPYNLHPYNQTLYGTINSDDNQDGFVTMYEAYNYVLIHNTKKEFANIESNPDCLKYSLALDALLDCLLIPGWDLYMQDNPIDRGEEPNSTTEDSWVSQDIWYEKEGQKTWELLSGETYDVCVKVRNRGEETSPANAQLYVHWTKATIGGAWPWGWYEDYTYDCGGNPVSRGGVIGTVVLPSIEGGGEYVARIPWTTPDVEEYRPCYGVFGNNERELMHYCILARIVDEQEQPDETITNLGLAEFILNYNNVVSQNVILSTIQNNGVPDSHIEEVVDITNPLPGLDSGPYTLTCSIEGVADWDHMAEIRLTFDSVFMSSQSNMTWSHCYAINNLYGCFYLEDGALFEEIYFLGNDNNTYPIQLNIDSYTDDFSPCFKIKLVLRDWDGYVVNGEMFEFKNDRPDLANVIRRPPYTEEPENEMEQQSVMLEDGLTIDVYNAQGMHLKHCDNCDIPSLNLPKGIYIYRMQGENQSYTKKVIK